MRMQPIKGTTFGYKLEFNLIKSDTPGVGQMKN